MLVVVHGQKDDLRVRMLRRDLQAEVQATPLPDAHIAQDYVGPLLGHQPERRCRRRRLTDDQDLVGEVAEHGNEPMQHHLVIVDEHDTERGRSRILHAAKPTATRIAIRPNQPGDITRSSTPGGDFATGVTRSDGHNPDQKGRCAMNDSSVNQPLVVPSVLPADFARLGDEVAELCEAGVDRIQWDVMDGVFVPNLTFGPDVIAAARPYSTVGFEAHLMVVNPDELLGRYIDAGCELVIVHAEACTHLHRTLGRIRDLGARSAVALNPHTPAEVVEHVLSETDLVLAMTVNPGFGGQAYIPAVEAKIARLRRMIDESGLPIELEVDGGITDKTIAGAARAGADVFISGSWMYAYPDGKAAAVKQLRATALENGPHRDAT
jgi:ribulose-phosphate 3-epimerase